LAAEGARGDAAGELKLAEAALVACVRKEVLKERAYGCV
jgi:hypothetical protein